MIGRLGAAALAFTLVVLAAGLERGAHAAEPVCRKLSYEGQGYAVCTADLRRQEMVDLRTAFEADIARFRELTTRAAGR